MWNALETGLGSFPDQNSLSVEGFLKCEDGGGRLSFLSGCSLPLRVPTPLIVTQLMK